MRIFASNEKRDGGFGVTFYRMQRIVGPVQLRMDVAISRIEIEAGRSVVARRLWRARSDLRRAVIALEGAEA